MINIDAFMADAVTRDTIPDFASPSDHFTTAGGLEFDFFTSWRLRSGQILDFKGATLELDVDLVTDEMLRAGQAIVMIPSEIGRIYGKKGDEAWAAVSTGMRVMNVRLVANFSKLAARARALGVPAFAIAGCGLQGHDAKMSGIELADFGAYGREAFPLWIAGADSAFDTSALYSVDPARLFDELTEGSSIEYRFVDYVPDPSTDQVTVGMIVGATCPENFSANPYSMSGPYRQIMRRDASLKYDVTATGQNIVQGGTIYQSLKGTVDGRTTGALVGYYSDYYKSKGIHILPTCSFKGGEWGAIIRLSPIATDLPGIELGFSAEDFVIEKFDCDARSGDVYVGVDPLPDGSLPPTRYIRNIAIDERLRVVNDGNRAEVVRTPAPDGSRRGCNPFGFLPKVAS